MMHLSPHKRPHRMMLFQPSISGQNWQIYHDYGHSQASNYPIASSRLQPSNYSNFSKKKKKGKRNGQKIKANQGSGQDKRKEKALPLVSQAPFPKNKANRLPKTITNLPPEKRSAKLKKTIMNTESNGIKIGMPIQPPIIPIHSSILKENLQIGNKNDLKSHRGKERKVPIQPPLTNLNDPKVMETEDIKHSSKKKKNKKGQNRRNQKGTKKNKHRKRLKIQRRTIAQNYKTELCQSHQTLGYCEYENLCQFAHGVDELKPRQFGLKYKTEECKNYHADGHCRFGSRCKFLHDEKRLKKGENEFWLVSDKENLIRVEVVENELRKAQLEALIKSPNPDDKPPQEAELWSTLNVSSTTQVFEDNSSQMEVPLQPILITPVMNQTNSFPSPYCSVYHNLPSQSTETMSHRQRNTLSELTNSLSSQSLYPFNHNQNRVLSEQRLDIMESVNHGQSQLVENNALYYAPTPQIVSPSSDPAHCGKTSDIRVSTREEQQDNDLQPQAIKYETMENEIRSIEVFDGSPTIENTEARSGLYTRSCYYQDQILAQQYQQYVQQGNGHRNTNGIEEYTHCYPYTQEFNDYEANISAIQEPIVKIM